MTPPPSPNTLPLAGIRVIEFCSTAAGPFCAMLLADMGAEVIKVEPPEGDGLRQWPPLSHGYSENFASLNRNKQSLVLNLKDPADQALAQRLVMDADVVVENNRPGVMDRLGLGYAAFCEAKPQLLYCSISAYGQTGPRAHEGGFDLTIQAASGVMSVTGEPDSAPVKCGVPISDFASGLYAAFAIAAKLAEVAVIFLIVAMLYEVTARYVFHAPTVWAFDIATMSSGVLFVLGAAWVLRENAHVRIDFLSSRLPVAWQRGVEGVVYLLALAPVLGGITWAAIRRTYRAWAIQEVDMVSPWQPLMWPFYTLIALGLALLTLQLLVQGLRALGGQSPADAGAAA